MVYIALQPVVLCLQASDVGPWHDADFSTTLSNHLQPAGRLLSARVEARMCIWNTLARQRDANTKISPVNHHFKLKELHPCSRAFVMWSGFACCCCKERSVPKSSAGPKLVSNKLIHEERDNPACLEFGVHLFPGKQISAAVLRKVFYTTAKVALNYVTSAFLWWVKWAGISAR